VSASGNRSTGPISKRPLGARSRKSYTMLGLIVTIVIVGLVAGALARLLVPGKQHLSIAMTIVLGVIGSFVGGFLGYLIFHKDATDGFLQPSGIIGSVIGAVIVLLICSISPRRLPHDGEGILRRSIRLTARGG